MQRQFLNALLATAALSADSGLLLVNRFTLSCKPLHSLLSVALLTFCISRHIQVTVHFHPSTLFYLKTLTWPL